MMILLIIITTGLVAVIAYVSYQVCPSEYEEGGEKDV